jgi:hypothetical protein
VSTNDQSPRFGHGTCPEPDCGRHIALTKLGKIRQHGSADKKAWPPRPCAGVGQPPKENPRMTRFATVTATTTAIAHTGTGVSIHPGRYEVAEIDGAAARGVAYVVSTAGTLVCIDADDPDITIEENPA